MLGRGALGAVVVMGFLCAAAAAGTLLSGDEIRQQLVGNTFTGLMEASEGGPSPYAEYYDPDGTIRGEGYAGHWTSEGDTMCLAYEQSPKNCWQVGSDDGELQWILNGTVQGTGKVAPGNPNNF
jgi:hypothetical protein